MSTTLERRPRELDPAATTNPASVIIVDDPLWPYARSLSKDKWHEEFKGDDDIVSFVANNNEPSAQTGKLSLFFDGTALKAKLPDGSVATLTQLGVGLYQAHDATLDAFAQAASGPDLLAFFSGVDAVSTTPFTAFARSMLDDPDAVTLRATIGLGSAATRNAPVSGDAVAGEVVLGNDSRLGSTSDPTLSALAALTVSAADRMIFSTGVETFGLTTLTAFARTLLDDADAATMRGTLGLGTAATRSTPVSGNAASGEVVLGNDTRLTGSQAADATLTGLSALATAADQGIYATGADTFAMYALTAYGRSLVAAAAASNARTTLGLGTLATLSTVDTTELTNSGVTYAKIQNVTATDRLLGRATAGAGVVEEITCTPFARTFLDDIDAATTRTTLGLGSAATVNTGTGATNAILGNDARLADARASTWGSIGGTLSTQSDLNTALTGKQPIDATLTALAALVTAADNYIYATGPDTFALGTITTFGRSLIDDVFASNARVTLGLGGAATLNVGTGASTVAAGDDGRFTDSRPLLAASTVPNHYFTEQTAVTTTPRTLAVTDSGTVLPMNAASGVVTIPTYAAGFKGFACEVYAVQATTVNATTTGTMLLAAGESCHIRAINGTWKVSKMTATAFT
jgi:hypothetical protein